VLDNGLADLVAFGKPYISNPDLVERFSQDVPLTEWDQSTFYTPGEKGYLDYKKKTAEMPAVQSLSNS
jgi:N-ethylmaleimide reductase